MLKIRTFSSFPNLNFPRVHPQPIMGNKLAHLASSENIGMFLLISSRRGRPLPDHHVAKFLFCRAQSQYQEHWRQDVWQKICCRPTKSSRAVPLPHGREGEYAGHWPQAARLPDRVRQRLFRENDFISKGVHFGEELPLLAGEIHEQRHSVPNQKSCGNGLIHRSRNPELSQGIQYLCILMYIHEERMFAKTSYWPL